VWVDGNRRQKREERAVRRKVNFGMYDVRCKIIKVKE